MVEPGEFKYEKCPLKHYVRIKGWLPNCKARRIHVNEGIDKNKWRRLRYFTFCAIGAIDVLMLDIAKVVGQSASGKFDTVVFFDRDGDAVAETQKRIPGAIGFPGNFTSVVLAAGAEPAVPDEDDKLASPADEPDTIETRTKQRNLNQRDRFIEQFPFDIVNLDLEEFAFKPNDPFPGEVVKAIRKVVQWQKKPLKSASGKELAAIDGFTLMFTTQIGPPNISAEYSAMLRDCLDRNVQNRPTLLTLLKDRVDVDQIASLETEQFDQFFKLGVRKVLADLLLEGDWYIDPTEGIKTFEFQRASKDRPYTMLHFVMDVKRQAPPLPQRAPGSGHTQTAVTAYAAVVDDLFGRAEILVTDDLAAGAKLTPSLEQIQARRKKYHPDPA